MTKREPQPARGQQQPKRLLLAAAVGLAIAVAACSPGGQADARLPPQSGPASDSLLATESPPLPDATSESLVPPSPVTTPGPTDRSSSPSPSPSPEQTASDAEPARSTVPVTMPAAAPVRLQIASIGLDSELVDLGLEPDGTLEVPPGGFPAGWYTGAPTPGELGPAIIAGHVDWGGQPGVFFDLREVSTGDQIAITRQDGGTVHFRVTQVDQFDKDAFPTAEVYGDLDHAGLRLITCGGDFDPQRRSYHDNLVVFAELVGSDLAR